MVLLAVLCGTLGAAPAPQPSYAVVVSRATATNTAWRPVLECLVARHQAATFEYTGSVWEAKAALARLMPRYVCFVAQPEEAQRSLVFAAHQLARALDDDPYGDCIWAILTGYDASDALQIARHTEPLVVRKVFSGTSGIGLGNAVEGVRFDEGCVGGRRIKTINGIEYATNGPADSAAGIAESWNTFRPDAIYTSGHGWQGGWQIGYSYDAGTVWSSNGYLFAKDTKGVNHPITSPNPKIYLPVGNCDVGDINARDCYSLAMMRSGGVIQMFGYTLPTFFGYMGWGIETYFGGQAGRLTLAESFFCNNQALVHEIETRFSPVSRESAKSFDELNALRAKHRELTPDAFGMLWDRDCVAFYGDPAWEARYPTRQLPWTATVTASGSNVALVVTTQALAAFGSRPLVVLFSNRFDHIAHVRVAGMTNVTPVVTEFFALLPIAGELAAGSTVTVTFTAVERQRDVMQ